jgi:hypothetical protein
VKKAKRKAFPVRAIAGTSMVCKACGCRWKSHADHTLSLYDAEQRPCAKCNNAPNPPLRAEVPEDAMLRRLAERIARVLFTDGEGRRAVRLSLLHEDGSGMFASWSEFGAANSILSELQKQPRERRKGKGKR